jgi:hypothetical protein
LRKFQCSGGALGTEERANRIEFGNPNLKDASFCLDWVSLGRDGPLNADGSVPTSTKTTAPVDPATITTTAQLVQKQIEENKQKG